MRKSGRKKKTKVPYSPSQTIDFLEYQTKTPSKDTSVSETETETEPDPTFTLKNLPNMFASTQVDSELAKKLVEAVKIAIEEIIGDLRKENAALKQRIRLLEENEKEVRPKKSALDEYYEKLSVLEWEYHRLDQYGRRNNIEVASIPNSVADTVLEEQIIGILKGIDVNVTSGDIEACHRLAPKKHHKGPKNVILRFVNRKRCEEIFRKKRNLKSADLSRFGCEKVFVNSNLNSYYRSLVWNARSLVKSGLVKAAWYSNESIKIKKTENSKPFTIYDISDLEEKFPKFIFNS